MAVNFYKSGNSYYRENGQKINNLSELQKLSKAGGKEIRPPKNNGTSKPVSQFSSAYTDDKGKTVVNKTTSEIPKIESPAPIVTPHPDDIKSKLKSLGLSDSTIGNMSPEQQAMFAGVGEVITKQYEQNNPVPQTFTAADLDNFFQQAQNDQTINDYYKEQLRIGSQQFSQAVALQQQDYQALQDQQQKTNVEQQKQLAEQQAAGGAAYSGFRQQAQQKLSTEQQGIIESSRRQAQQAAQSLGSQFEQTYGTKALEAAGVPNIYGQTYNKLGNVAGTLEQQRLLDIRQKEQDLINKASLTRGL